MQLLTITDAGPPRVEEVVFREERLGKGLVLLVMGGIIAALAWGWWIGKLPPWIMVMAGGMLSLFFLAVLGMFRKSFGPECWVLRVAGGRVLVKFRSYLNEHFDDDDEPCVVSFDAQDIAWAAPAVERTVSRADRGGLRVDRKRCLDLHLVDSLDTTPLAHALAAERAHAPVGGGVAKSKAHHAPAWLTDAGRTFRIGWRTTESAVTPRLNRALHTLAATAHVPTRDTPRVDHFDLRGPAPSPDRAAAESQILHLLERGHKIQAIKLTRRTYRCSLHEARDFIAGLQRSPASHPRTPNAAADDATR